jgi:hypothetical protein
VLKLDHEVAEQYKDRVVAKRVMARRETWRLRDPEAMLLWGRDTLFCLLPQKLSS